VGFHPRKIILFGSYAYGKPQPESEVDMRVVMETPLSGAQQAAQISKKIDYNYALDILVYTPEKLAQRIEWGDSIF